MMRTSAHAPVRIALAALAAVALSARSSNAQQPPSEPAPAPPSPPASESPPVIKLTPTGYIEAYYAWNFNRPQNGITNYRAFDNRHDSLTLQNVALGTAFESGPVGGRILLQVGAAPSSYYTSEPRLPGSSGANATSGDLWKYLQEAYLTWKAPVGRGLLLQAGLAASPIGYEVFAVKDNWNWSRSNLFNALPFFHTGLRATYEWTDALSTTLGVFNGWNSVVDNNEEKSVQASVLYKVKDAILVQALYFGGIERSTGSPEGPHWRHHFDAFAQYDANAWLSLAAQADYGWEPTRMGTASWVSGAAYARVRPLEHVYLALRGDRFHENVATSAGGGRASTPIFWNGAEWVSSATATIEVRPKFPISARLEVRHDVAERALFFRRDVQGDGSTTAPYAANARTQDTLLLGATAWF